jgi:hypothetical protein
VKSARRLLCYLTAVCTSALVQSIRVDGRPPV